MTKVKVLISIAALCIAAPTFADEVKFPAITPTCKIDASTCIEGYVARPDVTVRDRLGKGNFDRFIEKNGLEGMGITLDTYFEVGPLLIQS